MKEDYLLLLHSAKVKKKSNEAWLKQIKRDNSHDFLT